MDYNYDLRILGETTQILERARGNLNFDAQLTLCAEIGSPSALIVDQTESYDWTVIGPKGCGASRYMQCKEAEEPSTATSTRPAPSLRRALPTSTEPSSCSTTRLATGPSPTVEALRSLFDLSSTEICLMHMVEPPWIQLT